MNVLAELLHELSHLKHIRDWRIIPASNSIYKEYNVFSHLKPTKAQITKVFNQIRPLLTQVSFPVILGKEVTDKNYQDTGWKPVFQRKRMLCIDHSYVYIA